LRGPLPVPTLRDAALVVVLGVACTALAHTLFIASMRRLSAHTASVVSVLEPVYGIVLAAVLLGEHPDLRTLAGTVLIVAAALLATRQATR
jgi:drug/metabolite transporter (DMT)-like permease